MAMTRCRKIAAHIREADEPALEYLNNVVLEYLPEFTGFKLFFHFTPNPYFSDAVLSKTFEVPKMLVASMEAEVVGVPGCEIDWKPGMSLVQKPSGPARKTPDSFFELFASPDLLADPTTAEEAFAVSNWLPCSYIPRIMIIFIRCPVALLICVCLQQRDHVTKALTIGYALKNKVIPYAVSFYDGTYVEELDDDEEEEQYGA
jgi:hypothetical protein